MYEHDHPGPKTSGQFSFSGVMMDDYRTGRVTTVIFYRSCIFTFLPTSYQDVDSLEE